MEAGTAAAFNEWYFQIPDIVTALGTVPAMISSLQIPGGLYDVLVTRKAKG